jgi:hypothetical protein
MGITNSGAIAPPIWLAMSVKPDIVALWLGGNQRATTTEAPGNAPASPAPKKNLVSRSG